MEKLNRKELLQYIKDQETKNAEYRKRFRDLVTAYKGLQNEKTALESSLKALSCTNNTQDSSRSSEALKTDSSLEIGEKSDETTPQEDEGKVVDILDTKNVLEDAGDANRISALKTALTTLTEQKTRTENNFLADKRKLKQEFDDLKKELEEKLISFEQEKSLLQKTIQQLRFDIGKEQHQRQEDHNQQTLMMRELQAKLISERANREKFEQQYESLVWQQKGAKTSSSSQQRSVEEYEKMLGDLTKEMSRLRKMHEDAMEKARKPNPVLLELQHEMKDIKVKHQEAVADEQRQSVHAKAELRSLALSSENRITSLESKVAELSQMVGNYDRLRTQDQTSIQKLKERIAQLDQEKSLLLEQQLAPSSVAWLEKSDDDQGDSNLDVHALAHKITKLKGLLHLANQRSQKPLDTNVLIQLEESTGVYPQDGDIHSRCQEELEQLKDEFEHYKARAQTVLRSKAAKDHESHGELESLRHHVSELKGRLKSCRSQCDRQAKEAEERIQGIQQEHKQKMQKLQIKLEAEHSAKLLELEQQIQKQRDRTLALLTEKDNDLAQKEMELATFKMSFTETQFFPFTHVNETSSKVTESKRDSEKEKTPPHTNSRDNLPEMLSEAMNSSNGDHLILHYVQDIARKDVEIGNLRRLRHQAETTLRELQRDSQSKEEQYSDDLEALQSKIYRLESSEEGMNMEYLKNVVLRYVLCKDVQGKRRILNAIAAVLHFTAKELEQARMGLGY